MNVWLLLLINLSAVAGVMFAVWFLSVAIRNASIVDIIWGPGFVAVAWATFIAVEEHTARQFLLVAVTTIWGLRLGAYLAWRNAGKPEDYRYVEMRRLHGGRFWIVSLFTVFALQGAVMWTVSLPVQIGQQTAAGLYWLDAIGVAVWTIGLLFESIGDLQLALFKRDPANKGKVMNLGLWRYTRHPNYFGDFLVWWGIYLIAAAGGAWWTVLSPLLMSFLLLRVSGVTLLEKSLNTRLDGYTNYVRRTSPFFPWPPRKAISQSDAK